MTGDPRMIGPRDVPAPLKRALAELVEEDADLSGGGAGGEFSHTETPEQARERITREAVARSERWRFAVPSEFQAATLADFDQAYRDVGERFLKDSRAKHLIIAGPTGVGKSRLAGALGNLALNYGRWSEWYRVSDLLRDLLPGENNPRNPYQVETNAARAPFMVFDDLTAAPVKEWSAERLTSITSHRTNSGLKTVWTTNASEAVLTKVWGDRLLDLMRDGQVTLAMQGPSWRRPAW